MDLTEVRSHEVEKRKAICVMLCGNSHIHGVVKMEEQEVLGPVIFKVELFGASPGKHGFHVHKSGNLTNAPHGLCDHYNPTSKNHGDLNEIDSHMGDLGNLIFNSEGKCEKNFVALKARLRGKKSIIGRSLIIHSQEDDLGKGNNKESLKNGNSGDRLFFGVIGLDEC